MSHDITGRYRNAFDQPTVVCACGWRGDTDDQHDLHVLEMARHRDAAVADARKALKK